MESSSSPVLNNTNPSAILLLDQAQSSAKRIVCEWIRETLFEAFVQALQKTWIVTTTTKEWDANSNIEMTNESYANSNGSTTLLRVEISHDALQRAHGFVAQLAQTWEQKLQQSDQHQVAEWVREVLDLGKATLWRKQPQEDVVPDKGQDQNLDIDDGSRLPPPATAAVVLPSSPTPPTNETAKNHHHHQSPQLSFTRLRRLGARSAPPSTATSSALETDPAESALATIREMGRNGETQWPLDWNQIDAIIDKIPTRLHADKKPANAVNSSGGRVEPPPKFTVIPKALWEKQQQQQLQQQQTSHEQDGLEGQQVRDVLGDDTAALALLVDQQRHEPASKRRKKSLHHKMSIPEEEPRPPSDISHKKYTVEDIIASFSPLQRKQVDRLLHPEDGIGANQQQQTQQQQQHHNRQGHHDAASPLVLFGALKSVGHTHFHLQKEHDNIGPTNVKKDKEEEDDDIAEENETNLGSQTTYSQEVERFRRQEAGWAFLERLGRNEVEANVDPRRFRSKILRTVGRDNRNESWWELDVGECIMEVRLNGDDEGRCKRLCAFSSLELSLREGLEEEEDAPPLQVQHGNGEIEDATI